MAGRTDVGRPDNRRDRTALNLSPTPTRRHLLTGALLIAGTASLPVLHAQPKLEKTKIMLVVDGRAALYYLPLTIAEQLGYFRAEGIDLQIVEAGSAVAALQAVTSGAVDVCSGAYEQVLGLQSKNQMFQSFVLQGRAPQIAFGVSTKTMHGYKALSELKGKKIGVPAVGSPSHIIASRVLLQGGVRPDEVNFVAVGMAAGALQALKTGQLDAMSNIEPLITMMEQKGEIKVISDTRTLKGTRAVFGGPMPAACLYAATDFVRKNQNTCQAMTNAIVHGLKWLQTAGPGDIIKTVPESYFLNDRGMYLAAFEKVRESLSPDGVMPDDGPRTALRAMAEFDSSVREDRVRLSGTFTNEFAQRAKERFKA